jgi:cephalosporin hydroxylase
MASALLRRVAKRLLPVTTWRRFVARRFHIHYYRSFVWQQDTYWLGTETLKCPLDLWVYQELIHEVRPDLIVETGTMFGGSAHFLGSMCHLLGHGRVISIDVEDRQDRPEHPRVEYVLGSSTSNEVVTRVQASKGQAQRVMVILDADHSRSHVLEELRAYAPIVTTGSYLIVEDTNLNGHPMHRDYGPGPMEAVNEFLAGRDDFVVDRSREKFILTFSPRGFLRKVAEPARGPDGEA